MKIVIISALYKPHVRGGAEVVVCEIVDELKKNHEVVVITTCEGRGIKSLIPCQTSEDGIKVYRFYPFNIFSAIAFLRKHVFLRLIWHVLDVFNAHSFFVIRSLITKEQPDIILTHNLKGIGYLTPLALRGKKVIHTVHDFQLITPSGVIVYGKEQSLEHRNPFTWLYKIINRMLFQNTPTVVFPSQFLRDYYVVRGFFKKSKVVTIPNPVQRITNYELRITNVKKITKNQSLQLLFVGQLEEHKGILFLLDALQNERGIHLTIIGSGSCEQKVSEFCKKVLHYEYKGFMPHDALHEYIQHVHYLIVPSLYYENAPMVILESLSCGTPVIASRIGGIPEIIIEEKNGFLFEPGNAQSLLDQIRNVKQTNYQEYFDYTKSSTSELEVSEYCKKLFY